MFLGYRLGLRGDLEHTVHKSRKNHLSSVIVININLLNTILSGRIQVCRILLEFGFASNFADFVSKLQNGNAPRQFPKVKAEHDFDL